LADTFYYDINVQVWSDPTGVIYYSVIQENDESEDEQAEPLVYGTADTIEEALVITRDAVAKALTTTEGNTND